MHTATILDRVKVYSLDAQGRALSSGEAFPLNTQGTSGASPLPLEVACAVNEYAYIPGSVVAFRGRKRGRMFLPAPTVIALGTQGQFTSQYTEEAVSFVDDLFQGLRSIVNVIPVILSQVAGAAYDVTHLRTDSIPDVQRSRRRSQVKLFQFTRVQE
jgi:hypothetical protein